MLWISRHVYVQAVPDNFPTRSHFFLNTVPCACNNATIWNTCVFAIENVTHRLSCLIPAHFYPCQDSNLVLCIWVELNVGDFCSRPYSNLHWCVVTDVESDGTLKFRSRFLRHSAKNAEMSIWLSDQKLNVWGTLQLQGDGDSLSDKSKAKFESSKHKRGSFLIGKMTRFTASFFMYRKVSFAEMYLTCHSP